MTTVTATFCKTTRKALSVMSTSVSYNVYLLYGDLKYGFNASHPTDPIFSAFKLKIHLCKPIFVNIFCLINISFAVSTRLEVEPRD